MSTEAWDDIVRRFGTPTYVYDLAAVDRAWHDLAAALPSPSTTLYSLKANPHPAVARHLRELGAGAEVSSVGELHTALAAGWPADALVLTGPAKTDDVLHAAIGAGCRRFSVESVAEVARLAAASEAGGVEARAVVRVNVDVGAGPRSINFGGDRSHFGINEPAVIEALPALLSTRSVAIEGVHLFLASNVATTSQLAATFLGAIEAASRLHHAGLPIRWLDLGGGFGAAYARSEAAAALDGLRCRLEPALDAAFPGWRCGDPHVVFESGRFLVGPAGTLLTRVVEVKQADVPVVVLDTGIHHLGGMSGLGRALPLRPTLVHGRSGPTRRTRVVGPLCTTLDTWTSDAELPCLQVGDLLAVPNVGAYGLTASLLAFLSHDAPAEVVVGADGTTSASRLALCRAAVTTVDHRTEEPRCR